jgi:hypothetical protein
VDIRGIVVQFTVGTEDLSLVQSIQTSCGTHPISCSLGSMDFFASANVAGT